MPPLRMVKHGLSFDADVILQLSLPKAIGSFHHNDSFL